jgi:hypothetical protein
MNLVVVWKLYLVRKKCWKRTCMTGIWYWSYWLPSGNIKTLVYPHYTRNLDARHPLSSWISNIFCGRVGVGGIWLFSGTMHAIWLSHVSVIFGIKHSLKRLAPDIFACFSVRKRALPTLVMDEWWEIIISQEQPNCYNIVIWVSYSECSNVWIPVKTSKLLKHPIMWTVKFERPIAKW